MTRVLICTALKLLYHRSSAFDCDEKNERVVKTLGKENERRERGDMGKDTLGHVSG